MPKHLALALTVVFVSWLFINDRKQRPMTSKAQWIAFLWMLIIASKPVSFWILGRTVRLDTPDVYLDGSPLDRSVYVSLLTCAVVALTAKRTSWWRMASSNVPLVMFFVYWGASTTWSDYPFVALKRWIKDVGTVAAVMIIATDGRPTDALRAVLSRVTYIVVPFSVLLIKYYAELGRYLSSSWENAAAGVAVEKNGLGALAFVAGMYLVWDSRLTSVTRQAAGAGDLWARAILGVMVAWLMRAANSSAAWIALALGVPVVLFLFDESAERRLRRVAILGGLISLAVAVVYSTPLLQASVLSTLGEDATLTGRTVLWRQLLSERLNPVFGVGYNSFWIGDRATRYWEMWNFHPNQAHNGFLETYLNGGIVAVGLLVILLVTTTRRLWNRIVAAERDAILLFAFFIVMVLYNWIEAMFNKLSPIWFLLLLAAVQYPRALPLTSRAGECRYRFSREVGAAATTGNTKLESRRPRRG